MGGGAASWVALLQLSSLTSVLRGSMIALPRQHALVGIGVSNKRTSYWKLRS